MKQSAIEIFEAAQQGRTVESRFTITTRAGVEVDVMLTAPDTFDVYRLQQKRRKILLAECIDDGMDQLPINESAWQEELAKIKDPEVRKKFAENSKPENLAEQHAAEGVVVDTILEILPQYMRDPKTKKLLFPTREEQHRFKAVLKSDMELFVTLLNKYVELSAKLTGMTEQAKN